MASNLNQREAALRAAMAKATLSERKRLNAEIKEIQAVRQAKAQQERSIDLSARDVRSTLTPVSVHGMHSFESDWVSDLDSTPRSKTAIRDIDRNARSEAAEWFRGVHAAVRADRIEFREQAKGFARRYASQFGAIAPDVEARTLQHIAGFYRQAEGTDMAGVPSAAGDGTNPDSTSWAEQVALPPGAGLDQGNPIGAGADGGHAADQAGVGVRPGAGGAGDHGVDHQAAALA